MGDDGGGDAGGAVLGEALEGIVRGAVAAEAVHQFVRDQGGALADLGVGGGPGNGVAEALDQLRVRLSGSGDVGLLGDVEGQQGLDLLNGLLLRPGQADQGSLHNVDVFERALVGLGTAVDLGDGAFDYVEGLLLAEDNAVSDSAGEPEHLRAHGADMELNVVGAVAALVEVEVVHVDVAAVIGDFALHGEEHTNPLDDLSHGADGFSTSYSNTGGEGVPPSAEAQDDAAGGQEVQGGEGLGDEGEVAGPDGDDAGADTDTFGLGGEDGEGADGVGGEAGLDDHEGVNAAAVGLTCQFEVMANVEAGELDAEGVRVKCHGVMGPSGNGLFSLSSVSCMSRLAADRDLVACPFLDFVDFPLNVFWEGHQAWCHPERPTALQR